MASIYPRRQALAMGLTRAHLRPQLKPGGRVRVAGLQAREHAIGKWLDSKGLHAVGKKPLQTQSSQGATRAERPVRHAAGVGHARGTLEGAGVPTHVPTRTWLLGPDTSSKVRLSQLPFCDFLQVWLAALFKSG